MKQWEFKVLHFGVPRYPNIIANGETQAQAAEQAKKFLYRGETLGRAKSLGIIPPSAKDNRP